MNASIETVVAHWKQKTEENIAGRRRRLAEIQTNINLLKQVQRETNLEIARAEGLLHNLVAFANDVVGAAFDQIPVDSGAVIHENDPPGTDQRPQPEVKWLHPNDLAKDSSARTTHRS